PARRRSRRLRGRAPGRHAPARGGRVARAEDRGRGPPPRLHTAGWCAGRPGARARPAHRRDLHDRWPALQGVARRGPRGARDGPSREPRWPPGRGHRRRLARDPRAPAAGPGPHGRRRLPARVARAAGAGDRLMGAGGAAPERVVALRVLARVRGGAYADRALAGEARRAGLEGRDRARAHRLAYGAVQRARTLDWVVDEFLDRPAALEDGVREGLRLGAYELLYSGGAADAAVGAQ